MKQAHPKHQHGAHHEAHHSCGCQSGHHEFEEHSHSAESHGGSCCQDSYEGESAGGCGCKSGEGNDPYDFQRRFYSKEEQIQWLEEYKAALTNEIKGIDDYIEEIKGK